MSREELWKIRLAEIKTRGSHTLHIQACQETPIYDRQSEALCRSHNLSPHCHVFAVQVGAEARKYCVIDDLKIFYSWYSLMDPSERHYFEDGNLCTNVADMMKNFKDFVKGELLFAYPEIEKSIIKCVDLHLVFIIDDYAFKSNLFAGEFVRYMLWKAKNQSYLPPWFIKNESGELVPFVDSCVYSKNRNIRLFLSCKRGKGQVFVASPDSDDWFRKLSSFDQLRYSLISVNRRGSLVQTENFLHNPLSSDSSLFDHNHNHNHNHDDDSSRRKFNNLSSEPTNITITSVGSLSDQILSWLKQISGSSFGRISKISSSPYSSDKDGKNGGKYCYVYISGNRFCQKVGRQHKSNNIYFLCDLERHKFRQCCFDPDCRSFPFPWIPYFREEDLDEDEEWKQNWDDESKWVEQAQ